MIEKEKKKWRRLSQHKHKKKIASNMFWSHGNHETAIKKHVYGFCQLGYVTFPNEIGKHRGLVVFNKTNTEMNMEKNSVDLSIPVITNKISHTHEWIPGQIRHHSFIPAHVHHIYLPLIITRTLQTVIVKPSENLYDFYPRHYGGYGLGSYAGGQGAGHGFQIIFNP
ncbi:hypothetical protein NQ314_003051 [Rhamnusium bicolor]|uniref:Uncharacterized protein n=1 Tax=Rhamnusium bicolor TaxID=1586634 RepID=A0AAV8ZRF1_9CUCU|nr:hypothetical protein NQ314_003051 [Rhamnusium bicolor]